MVHYPGVLEVVLVYIQISLNNGKFPKPIHMWRKHQGYSKKPDQTQDGRVHITHSVMYFQKYPYMVKL